MSRGTVRSACCCLIIVLVVTGAGCRYESRGQAEKARDAAPAKTLTSAKPTTGRDTLNSARPAVVAFFVTTQAAVDADTGDQLAEALGDFRFYLPAIRKALTAHGIRLFELNDSTLVIRGPDGRLGSLLLGGLSHAEVGYWFFKPGAAPDSLLGSVLTHLDVLGKAAKYFDLPLLAH